jgi:hypothetical protein
VCNRLWKENQRLSWEIEHINWCTHI